MSPPRYRAALASCMLALLASCGPDLSAPDPGYESIRVDSFDLTDSRNADVDETSLDGEYTVVAFIFTNCPIYCPTMAVAMKRVQDATTDTNARLMSISVDGERDTPEVLGAYAASIGADPERWDFLTGDPAAVRALCEQQFLLGIQEDPSRPIQTKNGTMPFIDHPSKLILVGPDRGVIAMYASSDWNEVDRLIARLRRIAD